MYNKKCESLKFNNNTIKTLNLDNLKQDRIADKNRENTISMQDITFGKDN